VCVCVTGPRLQLADKAGTGLALGTALQHLVSHNPRAADRQQQRVLVVAALMQRLMQTAAAPGIAASAARMSHQLR
jgi:hypothetical protein